MEWVQFIIFFVGVFGLFIWNRAEGRADARHMDAKFESHRNLVTAFLDAVREEIKDFHNRLCEIERNRKGK